MNGRKKKLFIVLTAMIVLTTVMAFTVYAAGNSWRPENSEIYRAQDESVVQKATSGIKGVFEDIANIVGDVIGDLLAPFVRGLGDAVFAVLAACGCSLDAIVFGRVGGSSYLNKNVAMFTFELTEGNVYGTISMFIYNILTSAFLILMICVVLYRLLALLLYGYEKKIKSDLKRTLGQAVIFTAAVFIMPKAIDLLLYIRDVLLYAVLTDGIGGVMTLVKSGTSGMEELRDVSGNLFGRIAFELFGPAGKYSLVEMYREASKDGLMNSLMYLASNILTVYFAFVYISAALTFAVLMVLFPMCCVLDVANGGHKLSEWFEQILGLAMIPVIDAILLLFPITLALMNSGNGVGAYTFIQFILMMSIIPAREFVRSKLGFGSASGLERAGLGAGLAAFNLARAVAGAAVKAGRENKLRDKAAVAAENTAEKAEVAKNEADAKGKASVEKLQDSIHERFEGMSDTDAADAVGFDKDSLGEAEKEISESSDSVTSKNMRRYQETLRTRDKASEAYAALNSKKKDNLTQQKAVRGELNDLKREQARLSKDDPERANYGAAIADKERALSELTEEKNRIDSQMREYDGIRKDADRALTSLEAVGGADDLDALNRADSEINLEKYRDNPHALDDCSIEKKAELTKEYSDFLKKTNRTAKAAAYAAPVALGMIGAGGGAMLGVKGAATGAALGFDAGTFVDNAYENVAFHTKGGGSGTAIVGNIPAPSEKKTAAVLPRDVNAELIEKGSEAVEKYRGSAEKADYRAAAADTFASAKVLHRIKSGGGETALISGIDNGVDAAFRRAGVTADSFTGTTSEKEVVIRKAMTEEYRKVLTQDAGIAEALNISGISKEDRDKFYERSVQNFVDGSENYIHNLASTDRVSMSDTSVVRRSEDAAAKIAHTKYSESGRTIQLTKYQKGLTSAAETAYKAAVDIVYDHSFSTVKNPKERQKLLEDTVKEAYIESLRGNSSFMSEFTSERAKESACRELSERFASVSQGYVEKLSMNTGAYGLSDSYLNEQKKRLAVNLRETPEIVKRAAVNEMIAQRADEMTRCAGMAYNVSLGRLSTDRILQSMPREQRMEELQNTAKDTFIQLIGADQRVRAVIDRYEKDYGMTPDEILGHMSGRFSESSRLYFDRVVSGDIDVAKRVSNNFYDRNGNVHGPYDAFAVLDGDGEIA